MPAAQRNANIAALDAGYELVRAPHGKHLRAYSGEAGPASRVMPDHRSGHAGRGGEAVGAIVEDFEQIAFELVGHGREAEVVKHQEVGLGDQLEEAGTVVDRAEAGQLVGEARDAVQRTLWSARQAACANAQARKLSRIFKSGRP